MSIKHIFWVSENIGCPFTQDNCTNKEIIGFPFTYFDKHKRVNNRGSKYFVDPLVQNKHAAFSRFFIIFWINPFVFMVRYAKISDIAILKIEDPY